MRLLSLLLLLVGSITAEQHVPDDAAPNYDHVKELLRQSSFRSASLLGRDYDPSSIKQMASEMKDDGTEAYINREILSEVFESDIILNTDQAEVLLNQNPFGRRKRQLANLPKAFWPQPTVSFHFPRDQGIKDERVHQLIRKTLRFLESETCIRFKENGPGDGINFVSRGGCWSNLGHQGGLQQLSVAPGCDDFSIISHETLHALGVWHEQSRSDRDDYIRIDDKWISPGSGHNFHKHEDTNNYGNPYDFGSVMHYGPKSFTTNWNHNTMITKDPNYQQTLGQRVKPSFKDFKLVNDRYCANICKAKLPCANKGYTDPNNCNKCKCPSGYAGRLCDQLEKTSCGGELKATGKWQTLRTNLVNSNDNCIWRIKAPGQKIEAVFDRVHFPCDIETCRSYVELKYHKSKVETGARLCCKPPANPIVSEGDEVLVFFTGSNKVYNKGYTGFSLRYRTSPDTPPTTTRRTTTPVPTTRPATRPISTTTTPRPTTTKPKGPTGCWGSWGAWSRCSKPCGGCGTKQRTRTCSGGNKNCQGPSTQTQPCNQQSCKKSTKTCTGRLLIPCDLLPKLRFLEQSIVPASPSRWNDEVRKDMASSLQATRFYRNPTSLDRIRRRFKRQSDHPMCKKKFTYICPTNLLTISIDWKTARPNNDVINMDDGDDVMECCVGYKANGGICQKI